jgi:hypothetical protein
MTMQKLPYLGSFIQSQVPVAGITGTDALTPFTVRSASANKVAISRFKLSGAAIAIASGVATVTLTAHLNTQVGQQVTFSGCTGASIGLNDQTWTITSITSTSVYTFNCNLADNASVSGTIVQEPVFTLPQGFTYVSMDANANIEVCIDNTYNSPTGYAVAGVATAMPTTLAGGWIILITGNATPVRGLVAGDGFAARMRCMGTTATSYFSPVG